MQRLLIASHNQGKVQEFSDLLAPLGIAVLSAAEAQLIEPDETGSTFTENAALKARAAAEASGEMALADDSGLVIPALNGAPGIYSARWAGPDKNFEVAFALIQQELDAHGVDWRKQPVEAYFICVLCLCAPEGKEVFFEGRVNGTLTFPARGGLGFGYDPIFIPTGHHQTFAQMEPKAKHAISHRAKAFAQLKAYLGAHS